MKKTIALVLAAVATAVFLLLPETLLDAFAASDEMKAIGIPALRIICLTFPLTAVTMMCGYTIEGQQATLYQMIGVHVLRDSTACAAHDPLKAIAVWKSGSYINLHLAPLTQGGNHSWGFITDSIGTDGHRYLSLHHRQNGDPLSYTQETYASIPLEELDSMTEGDSITLSIHTFKGIKTWNFKR